MKSGSMILAIVGLVIIGFAGVVGSVTSPQAQAQGGTGMLFCHCPLPGLVVEDNCHLAVPAATGAEGPDGSDVVDCGGQRCEVEIWYPEPYPDGTTGLGSYRTLNDCVYQQ